MRMPPGGNRSTVRGGSRAGWAAIAGIAIGALLLAGVDEPERASSAPPANLPVELCTAAPAAAQRRPSASRFLQARAPSRATTVVRRCR
jgi:hypothetical protein